MKRLFGVLATALVLGHSAYAANDTWSGGGSTDWNTAGNWSGGVPISTSTDIFNNNVNPGITLSSAGSALNLSFTGAGAGAFTVGTTGGPGIVLTSFGSISTDTGVTNVETVNAPLTIGASGTAATYGFTSAAPSATAVLDIGGTVTGAASSGSTVLTLAGTNTGNNTVSGVISNGAAGGTLGLVKSAAGTWVLSGNNTYSGGTTVTAGTLDINSSGTSSTNSAIGTGTLTIGNSAPTIDNTSGLAVTLATNNAISLTTVGFSFGGTNNLNLGTGAVTMTQSSTTVNLGGTNSILTMGGILTNTASAGNNSLTVNGSGNTLVLGGFNISNGGTAKNEGFAGSGNIIVNGALADNTSSGSSNVTYSGTGTLTLNGASTYSGTTGISSGVVFANNATSSLGKGVVTISGTGVLAGNGTVVTSGVTAANAIAVNFTTGSTLSPSNGNGSISHLTFALSTGTRMSVGSGTKLVFDLGAGGASDEVLVTGGSLAFGGQQFSDFTFNAETGFAPGTYTLMDTAAGISGLGANLTGTVDGFNATLSLANGSDDLILTVASVPEPSTWALMFGGLVLLGFFHRHRRSLNPSDI